MEVLDSSMSTNWADNAFLALSTHNAASDAKADSFHPMSYHSHTIPPSLLTSQAVERHGQVTPPDELSPAEGPRELCQRESSIPLEQLHNEPLWPSEPSQFHQQQQNQLQHQEQPTRSSKRKRPQADTTQDSLASVSACADANPQPPKRKRGRPKLNPQPTDLSSEFGGAPVTSARQSHLEKNRVAAHKCRQRKKEYITDLEARAREQSQRNKLLKESVALLRDEVLELKNEVLRHAGCGFWGVDEYLARCAGDLLGRETDGSFKSSFNRTPSRSHSSVNSPTLSTIEKPNNSRQESVQSLAPSHLSDTSLTMEDYSGLDLLEDYEGVDEDSFSQ